MSRILGKRAGFWTHTSIFSRILLYHEYRMVENRRQSKLIQNRWLILIFYLKSGISYGKFKCKLQNPSVKSDGICSLPNLQLPDLAVIFTYVYEA